MMTTRFPRPWCLTMPLASVPVLVAACTLVLPGCGSAPRGREGPYSPLTEGDRNGDLARRLTQEAAGLMDTDPERAEALLREALNADLYHGPAHNNLGVIFLGRGDLYAAAGEFEWSRKLMPGHPDPRMTLALTLERAGRIDEAIGAYRTALEVYPGHIPSMQALASAQMRHGRADGGTLEMLEEISLRGESEGWRSWARRQAVRMESRP
jgi:tetratricopeptide (TPR) repeat protein